MKTTIFSLLFFLSIGASASPRILYNQCAIVALPSETTGSQYSLIGFRNIDLQPTKDSLHTVSMAAVGFSEDNFEAAYKNLFLFAKVVKERGLCPCVDTSKIAPTYICKDEALKDSTGQPLMDQTGKPFTQNICTPDADEEKIMTELNCSPVESKKLTF